jgi:WD40 repeat protein
MPWCKLLASVHEEAKSIDSISRLINARQEGWSRLLHSTYARSRSAAFSPDSQLFAYTKQWNLDICSTESGLIFESFEIEKSDWSDISGVVRFSTTGLEVVSFCNDGQARVWDVNSKECIATFDNVIVLVASKGPLIALVGFSDTTIWVRDCLTGKLLATLQGIENTGDGPEVLSSALSDNGRLLFLSVLSRDARLWDVSTGHSLHIFSNNSIFSAAFSPDGHYLALGGEGSIEIINVLSRPINNTMTKLIGHSGFISSLAYSYDGLSLASGASDCTIRLWDIRTSECTLSFSGWHSNTITSALFSRDGTRLISTCASERRVNIWDITKSSFEPQVNFSRPERRIKGRTGALMFSPLGTRIFSRVSGTNLDCWDTSAGEVIMRFDNLPDSDNSFGMPRAMYLSPNGYMVAIAVADARSEAVNIIIYDTNTSACLTVLEGIQLSEPTSGFYYNEGQWTYRYMSSANNGCQSVWIAPPGYPVSARDMDETRDINRKWMALEESITQDATSWHSNRCFKFDNLSGWLYSTCKPDGVPRRLCWIPPQRRVLTYGHGVYCSFGSIFAIAAPCGGLTLIDLKQVLL